MHNILFSKQASPEPQGISSCVVPWKQFPWWEKILGVFALIRTNNSVKICRNENLRFTTAWRHAVSVFVSQRGMFHNLTENPLRTATSRFVWRACSFQFVPVKKYGAMPRNIPFPRWSKRNQKPFHPLCHCEQNLNLFCWMRLLQLTLNRDNISAGFRNKTSDKTPRR